MAKRPTPPIFPIVAIGASAGGLKPALTLFEKMPPQSGMAFVFVPHLKPDQPSQMVDILTAKLDMPVEQAKDGTRIRPNHVYVIAPNRNLTLRGGKLHSAEAREPRGQRRPIDLFLVSLAQDAGKRAICIILSGTGTNGSVGLRAIKGEGGIVLAQDPETADFAGMPQAAVDTGLVDLVLPPEDMPEALMRLRRSVYVVAEDDELDIDERDFRRILSLLQTRTRHDFTAYKRNTLTRRIHRRMGLANCPDLGHYLQLLRGDPNEVSDLVRDLLISASGFFRDAAAWKEFDRKVIKPLVASKSADEAIRAWVVGCSTGEEAYTLGMLLIEEMERTQKRLDIKIFATDPGEESLAFGRAGVYPATLSPEVSKERLERFFTHTDDTYIVRTSLREIITFAPQNALQDPPFMRMDIVSCRNLMIYLENEAQRRVLSTFHFALSDGGHLFLGTAETLNGQDRLFSTVSKKWRIYRKIDTARLDPGHFSLARTPPLYGNSTRLPTRTSTRLADVARLALLDSFAPPSVVIDLQFHVQYFHGDTTSYLSQPGGEPTDNLLNMARGTLRNQIRRLVESVIRDKETATAVVRLGQRDDARQVRINVRRLKGRPKDEALVLVSFVEADRPEPKKAKPPEPTSSSDAEIHDLESEVRILREELQVTIEQMESSNEELKASNEEVLSMNEELQSANEELETSKEELQSLNEELNTVNAQLQEKVDVLEDRTNDLNNLLNSTNIATLFLDSNLRIRFFTPAMKELMDLLATDVGRLASSFTHKLSGDDFLADARKVLDKLTPIRAEVKSDDGRWFIRHVTPYRTEDNRIDGVAITFTDVTALKDAEDKLRREKEYAELIVEGIVIPLLILRPDLTVDSANSAYFTHFKTNRGRTVGKSIFDLGDEQ